MIRILVYRDIIREARLLTTAVFLFFYGREDNINVSLFLVFFSHGYF
jgi:hypothetical protein